MNKLKFYSIMLFATLALTLPSCGDSSNSEGNTEKEADKLNDEKFGREAERDADFVVDAYTDGMIEIRLAERVKDRLTTQDAKDVAAMMITDHTAMGNDMRALATKKGISLPTELTKNQQEDIEDIAEETGIDLDKDYLDKAVSMHRDAVDLFEKGADKGTDGEVKAAFATGLPKIQHHLDMAKSARDRVRDMNNNKSTGGKNNNNNNNLNNDDPKVGGRR